MQELCGGGTVGAVADLAGLIIADLAWLLVFFLHLCHLVFTGGLVWVSF